MQAAAGSLFPVYCRLARVAIVTVLLGLVVTVGGFYFVGPVVLALQSRLPDIGRSLIGSLVIWHPTLLFMLALWFLQRAAGLLRASAPAAGLARPLELSGWLLMSGALAAATSRPMLMNSEFFARLLAETKLSYPVWVSSLFDGFVSAAVIGLVGLLVVLLGKVLRSHAAAAEELRQIF